MLFVVNSGLFCVAQAVQNCASISPEKNAKLQGMAISAGRLTQMISVLNPVLTRNAAGEMTEEWVSCGKIHADIRGRSSRERMQSGAEMAQAEIRIWVRGQSGREITAASRLHVLSGPWRDRILNVVGLPVPDATGGRLEILCRLGGEK